MSPPKYADLGKAAKDLLTKDYGVGETKIEVNTKAQNGAELKKTIIRPHGADAKGANATAELKYFYAPHNVAITEKWVTANILTQTVSLEKLAEGLKLDVDTIYNIASGDVNGLIKADHIKDKVRSTLDIDVKKRTGNASVVVAHEGVQFGVQGIYDTEKAVLSSQNATIAYEAKDFTVTAATDGTKVNASVFHNASAVTKVGVQISAVRGSSDTTFLLGGQYSLDKDAFLKAKVAHTGEAVLGYTQNLRAGVKATFGISVDTKNLETDAHKLGFALTINC